VWTYLASIPPYFLTSKPESCYRIRYETEIGVQTALGVTVPSIVALLSKDVLWLVGTAVLLGMPLAWTMGRMVLRNFPYSITVGMPTLVLVAAFMLGLALLSVAGPTLRAARVDPARTLRDE